MKQQDSHRPEQRRDTSRSHHIEDHRHDPYEAHGKLAEPGGRIAVTTTDILLPRRLRHALARTRKGHLDTHYDESGHFVRMTWRREN